MNIDVLKSLTEIALTRRAEAKQHNDASKRISSPLPIKVESKALAYSAHHRGVWFKPEYDFEEISIAQDTDSYLSRAINKKVNKVIVAGWDLVGRNPETVEYIKRRINEISYSTKCPFDQLLWSTFFDLIRYNNCIWVKARDEDISSGNVVTSEVEIDLRPIAGYFILPFETLELKAKINGSLKRVKQRLGTLEKEWAPRDIVHFYTNRKPGFLIGTPEILPVLDDIALLRRIEENVEDLIETNLFPLFHYKIGSDAFPEVINHQTGEKETDRVRRTLQYMPANGIYISDHRHEISAIGSEGRALRLDFYLTYFKNRVLSGMGTSPVDMGEGDTANKSTASTMSKAMLIDIEALTIVVKRFIEFYVISELLIEGGYNPLDAEEMVYFRFGTIDKEERRADENQQIQLFASNLRTIDEVRASLGDEPWRDEFVERTHYKMFGEPAALVNGLGAGSAAGTTLAEHPSSNITPAAVKKEEQFSKTQERLKKQGQPVKKSASKSAIKSSQGKARPSNQHGTRSGPKTNRDLTLVGNNDEEIVVTCDFDPDPAKVDSWLQIVYDQYNKFNSNVSLETIATATMWRLRSSNE